MATSKKLILMKQKADVDNIIMDIAKKDKLKSKKIDRPYLGEIKDSSYNCNFLKNITGQGLESKVTPAITDFEIVQFCHINSQKDFYFRV